MKRIVISAAVLSISLIGGGVSFAGDGDGEPGPGPNGHNNYGLCTAYAHNGGNSNGQAFKALEETAAEDGYKTVAEWCVDNGQKPGGGKGPGGGL